MLLGRILKIQVGKRKEGRKERGREYEKEGGKEDGRMEKPTVVK